MKEWKSMEWKNMAKYVLAAAVSLSLVIACLWQWHRTPSVITVDCRGYQIDVEWLNQMREQEKEGYAGILDITGYRSEPNSVVSCLSTGRTKMTSVLAVNGIMELVFQADVVSGSYGLAAGIDYCVLTKPLADALYGNGSAGGRIWYEGRPLLVAGVIDKDESYLLIPTNEGMMESVSVRIHTDGKIGKLNKYLDYINGLFPV